MPGPTSPVHRRRQSSSSSRGSVINGPGDSTVSSGGNSPSKRRPSKNANPPSAPGGGGSTTPTNADDASDVVGARPKQSSQQSQRQRKQRQQHQEQMQMQQFQLKHVQQAVKLKQQIHHQIMQNQKQGSTGGGNNRASPHPSPSSQFRWKPQQAGGEGASSSSSSVGGEGERGSANANIPTGAATAAGGQQHQQNQQQKQQSMMQFQKFQQPSPSKHNQQQQEQQQEQHSQARVAAMQQLHQRSQSMMIGGGQPLPRQTKSKLSLSQHREQDGQQGGQQQQQQQEAPSLDRLKQQQPPSRTREAEGTSPSASPSSLPPSSAPSKAAVAPSTNRNKPIGTTTGFPAPLGYSSHSSSPLPLPLFPKPNKAHAGDGGGPTHRKGAGSGSFGSIPGSVEAAAPTEAGAAAAPSPHPSASVPSLTASSSANKEDGGPPSKASPSPAAILPDTLIPSSSVISASSGGAGGLKPKGGAHSPAVTSHSHHHSHHSHHHRRASTLSNEEVRRLANDCTWDRKVVWVARQMLGGRGRDSAGSGSSSCNGFIRATSAAMRLKRQKARSLQGKQQAQAQNRGHGGAEGDVESSAGVREGGGDGSAGRNESDVTAVASTSGMDGENKRPDASTSTTSIDEEHLKLETFNVRLAKKIQLELKQGLQFCGVMTDVIRSILREINPENAILAAQPMAVAAASALDDAASAVAVTSSSTSWGSKGGGGRVGSNRTSANADAISKLTPSASALAGAGRAPPTTVDEGAGRGGIASSSGGIGTGNTPSRGVGGSPTPSPPSLKVDGALEAVSSSSSSPTAAGADGSTLRKFRKRTSSHDAAPDPSLLNLVGTHDEHGKKLTKREMAYRLFEATRFRTLEAGDYVAAKVTSHDLWILARVVTRWNSVGVPYKQMLELTEAKRDALFKEKVHIQDNDEYNGDISTARVVHRQYILPLPKSYAEANNWGTRARKGTRVYAMYPHTTALYCATVVDNTTYCRDQDDIIVVEFDGDEDDKGAIPQRHIPARFVTLIPREFPASQSNKKRKKSGAISPVVGPMSPERKAERQVLLPSQTAGAGSGAAPPVLIASSSSLQGKKSSKGGGVVSSAPRFHAVGGGVGTNDVGAGKMPKRATAGLNYQNPYLQTYDVHGQISGGSDLTQASLAIPGGDGPPLKLPKKGRRGKRGSGVVDSDFMHATSKKQKK